MTKKSTWDAPETVARFSVSPGNTILHAFAETEFQKCTEHALLDIGCGAGSNAIPLARIGWRVQGLDLSQPMLTAAIQRAEEQGLAQQAHFKAAPMDQLPVEDCSQDFIVAHGIWNLAGSSTEFRAGLNEAARVARPGAALFVYTFSRNTFPADTQPVEGETFVYTQFSGKPQCFLTEPQLIEELHAAGFEQEPGIDITEYPCIPGGKPAIYEAIFRKK
ncbi:MAG: class I SAM-dependent methyltransferase [Pontiella sp.]